MPSQDETLRLILEIQGRAEADDLRRKMDALRERIAALNGTMANTDPRMLALANQLKAAGDRASELDRKFGQGFEGAARGVNSLNYRMMVMATTLDDLQYVGEQGLRPILNNLTMIHPALGAVAIVGNQVYKNFDAIKSVGSGLFEYWAGGADKANTALSGIVRTLKDVKTAYGDLGETALNVLAPGAATIHKLAPGLAEGFDALSGGPGRRDKEAVAKFEDQKSAGQMDEAGAIKKGLGQFSGKEVLDALIDREARLSPDLAKDGDARDREKARLANLVDQAKAGDANAMASVRGKLAGTGIGQAIDAADPIKQAQAAAYKKQYDEEGKAAQDRADAHNQAIDDRRKGKADEVARAMESGIGTEILDNAARGKAGADPDDLAHAQKLDLAKRLRETGQVGSDEEARAVAKLAYDQIWGNTWKKIRERVNAGAGDAESAAAELAKAATPERQRRAAQEEAATRARLADAARREGGLEGRIADASGLADPVQQAQLQARETGLQRALRSPSAMRRFNRMTVEEREGFIGGINDRADVQLRQQVAGQLVRGGYTRNRQQAYSVANRLVSEQRQQANAQTGDPGTKAAEDNTKSIEMLTEQVAALNRNGVATRLK